MVTLSRKDDLTGLDNRRQFVIAFENSVKMSIQKNKKISLLLIELEGLKSIEKRHGEQAAKLVVSTFATLLSTCIDFTDQVFCYGKDQFTVIINNTENTSVKQLVKLICTSLECNRIMKEFNITYNVGRADSQQYDDFNSLVDRTEKSLFEAKNGVQTLSENGQPVFEFPEYDLVANYN